MCLGIGAYGLLTVWLDQIAPRAQYDPALPYMLSSLGTFRGTPYAYIDHPGTPVEVLGTLLLGLTYPFAARTAEGFVNFHLTHPEVFLGLAGASMVVATLIVCVLVGIWSIKVEHWSQALVASGLAATFFAIFQGAFPSLSVWSHDAFCFCAGTALALALVRATRRHCSPPWRTVLWLGFAAGVLTSVQLYFAAWIVGTAVALSAAARLSGSSWRHAGLRGLVVGGAAGVGFGVATLPIAGHYHQLAGWLWLLISHQGVYGSGPPGVPSPLDMWSSLSTLIGEAPVLFGACAAAVGLLAARSWTMRGQPTGPRVVAVGLGFVAQVALLIVLVAKHPGVRYLLPLAATVPMLLATALDGLDPRRAPTRLLLAALGSGLLAAFGIQLWFAWAMHQSTVDRERRDDLATEQMLSALAQDRGIPRPSLRTLWTYGTASACYALWFGDDFADRTFFADIDALCPNDRDLNVWNAKVATGSGDVDLLNYPDWDVIVVPEDVARAYPDVLAAGATHLSTIGADRDARLLFITRPV